MGLGLHTCPARRARIRDRCFAIGPLARRVQRGCGAELSLPKLPPLLRKGVAGTSTHNGGIAAVDGPVSVDVRTEVGRVRRLTRTTARLKRITRVHSPIAG